MGSVCGPDECLQPLYAQVALCEVKKAINVEPKPETEPEAMSVPAKPTLKADADAEVRRVKRQRVGRVAVDGS